MASIPLHPGERLRSNARSSKPRALHGVALALAAVALSGCQSMSMNTAQLRVIDASADAGVLDSYQNNASLAYNLNFGTMTSYVAVPPGTYTLSADRAGTRQTLAASTGTLAAGKQYTEIVGSSLVNLQQNLFADQSNPAPAGQVAIRLIHEASRSGPVDVYLVPASSRPGSTAPLASNLNFGLNTSYLNVPAGTYAIDVVPAGTTLAPSTLTLLSGPQLDYPSGAVRTVVLIDQEPLAPHRAAAVQTIVADDANAP